jgi:hypothetical protein
MSTEDWDDRLVAYKRQGRSNAQIRDIAQYLEQRGPRQPRTRAEGVARSEQIGMVTRALYVSKEDEPRHLSRDANGLPMLRLVDAGDRLAIWSPLDGGALLNPKGAGLRSRGRVASYARGTRDHASAYRAADLRKGRPVELRVERSNDRPHAIGMYAPGARALFGFIQPARSASVFHRIAGGVDMVGVCLWGPPRGSDDNTTHVLIGSRPDIDAMLS